MAVPVKAILIDQATNTLGTGLKLIRNKLGEAIDISEMVEAGALDDVTVNSGVGAIIKDNKVYYVKKVFMDLDTNTRILIGVFDQSSSNII